MVKSASWIGACLLAIPALAQDEAVGSRKQHAPAESANVAPGNRPFAFDERATQIARAAHALARAIDRLPRFYVESTYHKVDILTMQHEEEASLRNLQKAFHEPSQVATPPRLQRFGWDESKMLVSEEQWADAAAESDSESSFFGDRRSGWQRWKSKQTSNYGRFPNISVAWPNARFFGPHLLKLSRHDFWWGISPPPLHEEALSPEAVVYDSIGAEDFEGEPCDVVESRARKERLWISRRTGRIRGQLEYICQGKFPEFFKREDVQMAAGRPFAAQSDFVEWNKTDRKSLPPERKIALHIATNTALFETMATVFQLVSYRDEREIATGIWWPMKEVVTQRHHTDNDQKFKYARYELAIGRVATDIELSDAIAKRLPKDGDQVYDQRFPTALGYTFRSTLTEAEIQNLVEEEKQKTVQAEKRFQKLVQPFTDMIGRSAPSLPDTGWIGDRRPDTKGEPYLVHFWTTTCGPCKNDYPILNRLAEKGILVVGIHPGGTATAAIEKVIKDYQLRYSICAEEDQDSEARLLAGYPVSFFPYCIVVDEKGVVAGHGSLGDALKLFQEVRGKAASQTK